MKKSTAAFLLFFYAGFFVFQGCDNNPQDSNANTHNKSCCDSAKKSCMQDPCYDKIGVNQSPINIVNFTALSGPEANKLFSFSNLVAGDAVYKLSGDPGKPNFKVAPKDRLNAGTVFLYGQPYQLDEFHFHTPAEHRINGRRYPMEMHLVYKNQVTGRIIAVGVLMNTTATQDVIDLNQIFTQANAVFQGGNDVPGNYSLSFLPYTNLNRSDFYNYTGSLTTGDFPEGLTWFVMKTPISISPGNYKLFKSMTYKGDSIGYSRDTLPVYNRVVLEVQLGK
ncbi:MAG TPA: carbonic anhydrase family protein [Bacteroidia bacterium]|nr:carbonic anhydrase family protein [Bacteroidia bacterium]